MAVRTRDEILQGYNIITEGNTSDEVLALLEDLTDTLTEAENAINNYNALDTQWRERYRARFFDGVSSGDTPPTPDNPPENETEEETHDEGDGNSDLENIQIDDLFE